MTLGARSDFTSVTETWGLPASREQLAMSLCRYEMAGDLASGKRVLEVGSGSGMGLAYLRSRATLVVGGDYSLQLLQSARAHDPNSQLVALDAQALPFAPGTFDVVLLLEMIYYIPDLDRALDECRRVLAPGAELMVCLPNRDRPDFNPSPFSIRYPNVPELADLLQRHGFSVKVFGGFSIDPVADKTSLLGLLRRFAVRFHLIPRSMRVKALVKTLIYGPLPKLGKVKPGTAAYSKPVALASGSATSAYKNIYAVGRLTDAESRLLGV